MATYTPADRWSEENIENEVQKDFLYSFLAMPFLHKSTGSAFVFEFILKQWLKNFEQLKYKIKGLFIH